MQTGAILCVEVGKDRFLIGLRLRSAPEQICSAPEQIYSAPRILGSLGVDLYKEPLKLVWPDRDCCTTTVL